MKQYDLIIIGGGAGAFAAAIKANEMGAKTALINEGLPLGGTCVNVGCVPSKTLLHAAELIHTAKRYKIPGIEMTIKTIDYKKVVANELRLVEKLRNEKYEQVLQGLKNVIYIEGRVTFTSHNQIKVGKQNIKATKFIIATGSKAIVPKIEGLTEARFITHVEAMSLKVLPKRLIVIGAGPVGLELGQLYSRFGSEVTILQRSNNIIPIADSDLTKRLQQILQDEGLNIKTNVQIKKITTNNGQKNIIYNDASGEYNIAVDEILVAAGKKPNTAGLNLAVAGVKITNKDEVITKPNLQTSQPHIFAVGDVTNLPLRLETTAGREGTYAAINALQNKSKSLDYNSVPWTVFTDPQLASVGYTEEKQMKELKVCDCRIVNFDKLPKAIITNRTEGMIKVVIHPETKVIMGVHILGPNAGDLIAQAMVLIKNKNTIDDLENMLTVFPTLSDSIGLTAKTFTKDISKISCCI